jgi:SAM-dependent methyltransferase
MASSQENAKELSNKKDAERKEESHYLTLNKYGLMLKLENPHLLLSLQMMDKTKPVLDLGVAFGFSSKILLKAGYQRVIANDLDERHLQILRESLSDDERSRLELKAGNALDLEFEANSMGGIIALRWLHYLSGSDVRKILEKFFKWLSPGGILVVTVGTPLVNVNKSELDLESIYYERKRNGVEWPGFFYKHESKSAHAIDYENTPEWANFMFNDVLIREVTKAGFEIFKVEYFDRDVNTSVYSRDGLRKMDASAICLKR